jgi:predicted Fe-Mo cluster-binding NifX family protein
MRRSWKLLQQKLKQKDCNIRIKRGSTVKIAISSEGNTLESKVDPRFGRASYFIVVDPETMAFDAVENSQNLNLPQGAGIQAGKTVVDQNVDVLITGNCGPKAFKVLQSAGVRIFTGADGQVKEALLQYQNSELMEAEEANVEGHWV